MPNYAGIFTSKIYDQSDIEFPESYTALSFREDEITQQLWKEALDRGKAPN